jgi:H2-forming N5,N10-methylenetetrahydromethanopterin dehydrogenase-like enzyme
MTKQDYLLAVIDAMPDREMGRGIKAMIENNQIEDRTLDMLVIVFTRMVDGITDAFKKQRIMKSIENLNVQKQVQAKQDQADLQKLDGMLDDF